MCDLAVCRAAGVARSGGREPTASWAAVAARPAGVDGGFLRVPLPVPAHAPSPPRQASRLGCSCERHESALRAPLAFRGFRNGSGEVGGGALSPLYLEESLTIEF